MTGEVVFDTLMMGNAQITLLQDGELIAPAAELLHGGPEADAGQVVVPINVALVRIGGEVILIDTGLGTAPSEEGVGGRLIPTLAALGLTPEEITRVVITHLHADHVGGLLAGGEAGLRPAFPRARHHLPRADWEWARSMPGDPFGPFLQPLADLADLTLDAPDDRLTPALRSIDSAGHTPGHRCLLVEAGGQGFCFLGDLVHHPVLHFAQPERLTTWDAQPDLMPAARRRLAVQAVDGGWRLACTHGLAPAFGRLTPAGPDSWVWRPAQA